MGFRSGAALSLEKMQIPYMIWSEKPLKNPRKCTSIIHEKFPSVNKDVLDYKDELKEVTHVIAVTESAVLPASFVRIELNLYRNSKSVIVRCTDKFKMKEYLSEKGIPMTKFMSSRGQTAESISNILGLPLVNKVKLSSGGRGVRFITEVADINNYLDRTSYFEKTIEGVEGSIESFVRDKKIMFTNITEYYKNGVCNLVPAHFSEDIIEKIHTLNNNVISALNLKWGMTHLEYYITKDGILFGEVALRPPGGYIMETLGYTYKQNFWDLFIQIELIKDDLTTNFLSQYSSSIIIHPGEGRVKKIEGIDIIKNLKSKMKFKLKIKEGDEIASREGVGENCGHLILASSNKADLIRDIETYFSEFKIILE